MNDTGEQQENSTKKGSHLAPWQFKKGVSGNPSGRPANGKSLKEFAKEYLQGLSDEERIDYFEGMNKKDIWLMAEGNPHSTTDAKMEVTMPVPIAAIARTNDLLGNDSLSEDSSAE